MPPAATLLALRPRPGHGSKLHVCWNWRPVPKCHRRPHDGGTEQASLRPGPLHGRKSPPPMTAAVSTVGPDPGGRGLTPAPRAPCPHSGERCAGDLQTNSQRPGEKAGRGEVDKRGPRGDGSIRAAPPPRQTVSEGRAKAAGASEPWEEQSRVSVSPSRQDVLPRRDLGVRPTALKPRRDSLKKREFSGTRKPPVSGLSPFAFSPHKRGHASIPLELPLLCRPVRLGCRFLPGAFLSTLRRDSHLVRGPPQKSGQDGFPHASPG